MTGTLRPRIIGLTGPIGCGKSTVARMLAELGGAVIDADDLAREVTLLGEPTLAGIRARFGDPVFAADGSLDRAAMAAVVFNDPAALADLERIVHPAVRRRVEALLAEAAQAGRPFVAVEAIKLVEGGLAARCDEVWLIECAAATQLRRLTRRGTPAADAEQRVRTQGADLVERLAVALGGRTRYRRLSTDGSREDARRSVQRMLVEALAAAES